jgi:hypothetical protein
MGPTMHIEWCLICGAIILIQLEGNPEPCGDPETHLEWHRKRGEVPDA